MSDLKPCPFCGGEIGFDFEHDNFLCSGCWAIMPYSPNGETVNTRPIEDKLQAEIARLKAERRWIPVSEPPKKDGEYWVYISTGWGKYQDRCTFSVSYGWQIDRSGEFAGVTHWMPLPEPPSEEEC